VYNEGSSSPAFGTGGASLTDSVTWTVVVGTVFAVLPTVMTPDREGPDVVRFRGMLTPNHSG
jgi:hypothetical protein